ncbi:hypothetical protein D6I95_02675 [Alcaligenes faecalis]|nr:hypothetical protein D6I95_02675 [Alcaligenes faecalis]
MCFLSFNKPPKCSATLAIVREGQRRKKAEKTQQAKQGIKARDRENSCFKTRNTVVKEMTFVIALANMPQDKTSKPPD